MKCRRKHGEAGAEILRETIFAPKKVVTDSGSVEERSVGDLEKGMRLLGKEEANLDEDGSKRPKLGRLGFYGRINL